MVALQMTEEKCIKMLFPHVAKFLFPHSTDQILVIICGVIVVTAVVIAKDP